MTAKQYRDVCIIAGVAIGINVLEAFLVPNVVEQEFGKGWKFKMPSAHAFRSSLFFLIFTSSLGGFVSENVIAAVAPPAPAPAPPPPSLTSQPTPEEASL